MSGGLYGGDEVGALVLDFGTHSIRAGFAGEDLPKADFPSTIGRLPSETKTDDNNITDPTPGKEHVAKTTAEGKRFSFGTNAIGCPTLGMELLSMMKDGMIEDWDLFEQSLDHIYKRYVSSESSFHPVMMSEASWNARAKRETLCEIMFEKYDIPAFFLCKSAVLSAFANGRATALVFDSGAGTTSAVPVHDGYVLQNCIVRTPLGGDYIVNQCRNYIDKLKIEIIPPYLIGSKEPPLMEGNPCIFTKKKTPEVTKSFHDHMVNDVMREFSATVLQAMEAPFEERTAEALPTYPFEFPNGITRDFGSERFRIVESLFDPKFQKNPTGGVSLCMGQLVTMAVGMCDVDMRPSLYSNLLVTGGNTLMPGFTERLNVDLGTKLPPSMKLKLIYSTQSGERKYAPWVGGSILASLGSFQQMWISKQEYEEGGKACVERKCP